MPHGMAGLPVIGGEAAAWRLVVPCPDIAPAARHGVGAGTETGEGAPR